MGTVRELFRQNSQPVAGKSLCFPRLQKEGVGRIVENQCGGLQKFLEEAQDHVTLDAVGGGRAGVHRGWDPDYGAAYLSG